MIGINMSVNFEWMRPWYMHYYKCMEWYNQYKRIKQAYQLLDGDDFAQAKKERFKGEELRESFPPAPALTNSSNSPSAGTSAVQL